MPDGSTPPGRGAAGAGGHPLEVIEADVLHQMLAGQAGRIHGTRSSAPPAPMAIPWT
ncbi:hypothetical protein I5Q73_29055 [Pseudomonas aeruginosa]|uniref:hypothetical protein n=1 Tax=Pseudomonas aeruginosa TaxID=287 RepID=UPI001A24AB71|nr:hypothetical protein [Pseudomonas aeruginosa]HBO8760223.1 hypothetical protein [Pseudomonas aeruginosa]